MVACGPGRGLYICFYARTIGHDESYNSGPIQSNVASDRN